MRDQQHFNRRSHERFTLAPMYSSVAAIPTGSPSSDALLGHAYDISAGGVRLELDEPLLPGERVRLNIALPGQSAEVKAMGDVVWVNDEQDDPGPRRMALQFTGFDSPADRMRLIDYLGVGELRRAA
jgi:hypothetical protein